MRFVKYLLVSWLANAVTLGVVVVTHNALLAAEADRQILLRDGRLVEG